ncbi:25478_t:CDS:2, partial [Racocetra persica]
LTVVVETPAIDIESDSDNFSLLLTTETCQYCKAKFWMIEKNQNSRYVASKFPLCCASSKVQLPSLLEPLPYLLNLYTSTNSDAINFRKHVRSYNSTLVCTSFSANIDTQFLGR